MTLRELDNTIAFLLDRRRQVDDFDKLPRYTRNRDLAKNLLIRTIQRVSQEQFTPHRIKFNARSIEISAVEAGKDRLIAAQDFAHAEEAPVAACILSLRMMNVSINPEWIEDRDGSP